MMLRTPRSKYFSVRKESVMLLCGLHVSVLTRELGVDEASQYESDDKEEGLYSQRKFGRECFRVDSNKYNYKQCDDAKGKSDESILTVHGKPASYLICAVTAAESMMSMTVSYSRLFAVVESNARVSMGRRMNALDLQFVPLVIMPIKNVGLCV